MLTQFAIPNLNTLEYKSNVHLAPGYLVGYVKDYFPDTKFIITPRIYTDLLTESSYIEYAVNEQPDLLVFSLYLWNIEKSLRIVKKLVKLLPTAKFLFGGPEVNPDNSFLLSSEEFSEGIVGEGEVAFLDYLKGKSKDKIPGFLTKNSFNDFSVLRSEYEAKTNPYLANIIETKPDNTIYFETVRGCPFSCNFCYYNKVYDKIIPVGHDHLDAIFKYARENNFDEMFLLDPTFNIQPNFDKLLDRIVALNSDHRFEISTELRADFLTDLQIEKLVKMNLIEAEIGLQTTSKEAQRLMDRKENIDNTIEKTIKMIEAGISCKVDLIIGLPGDTLQSFKKSIDDVMNSEIHDSIQVFLLSILSGTEFSKQRTNLGINADLIPPYYINSTPTFSNTDIRDAIDYTEEALDVTLYPIPPYLLSTKFDNINISESVKFDTDITPIHKIIIESSEFDPRSFESDTNIKLCESIVIHFIITRNHDLEKKTIFECLTYFNENYPNNIYQFILDFRDCDEVDIELIETVVSIIPKGDQSYLSRDITANLGIDFNLTSSLAVIVPIEFKKTEEYKYLKDNCDTFLHIDIFDKKLLEELADDDDNNLFITGDIQREVFDFLSEEDLLDEYTIFDDLSIELDKDSEKCNRIYYPHCLIL